MGRNSDRTFSKAFAFASVITSFERTQKWERSNASIPGQSTCRIGDKDILGRPAKRKPVTVLSPIKGLVVCECSTVDGCNEEETGWPGYDIVHGHLGEKWSRRVERTAVTTRVVGIPEDLVDFIPSRRLHAVHDRI